MADINSSQEEKAPLLGENSSTRDRGVSPSEGPSGVTPGYITVPVVVNVGPDELPPPYAPSSVINGIPMVACRVCGSMVDITGKRDSHVVKCDQCNEATPIKSAPPGKKYVRCPCNCLLICKAGALRIACPRSNCKRIINLADGRGPNSSNHPAGSYNTGGNLVPVPGMCRVNCGYCHESFLFDTLSNQLARCPHCRKLSSVGSEFARTRGTVFLIISLFFMATAVGVTIGTHHYITNSSFHGLIALYVLLFVLAGILLFRSIYYLTMKISSIETTPT